MEKLSNDLEINHSPDKLTTSGRLLSRFVLSVGYLFASLLDSATMQTLSTPCAQLEEQNIQESHLPSTSQKVSSQKVHACSWKRLKKQEVPKPTMQAPTLWMGIRCPLWHPVPSGCLLLTKLGTLGVPLRAYCLCHPTGRTDDRSPGGEGS